MKRIVSAFPLLCLPFSLYALTLNESVQTTLDSNPTMQKRISDYKSIRYDLDKAEADYKPTVDLSAGIGPEHAEKKSPPTSETDLTRKEASLIVTENLFRGFNTKYNVQEQNARIESSRNYAMQEANTLALRSTETYLLVLRNKRLLDLEHENVDTHERIFKMTREKLTAGLGRRSDLEQTEARKALAYANYISQQNNYQDSIINFERVYGSVVSANTMETPAPSALPADTLSGLEQLAFEYNPTLRIERFNIKSQEAKHQKEQSGFYPTVNAELSADYKNNIDGFENDDRAYRAMLRLYYNLYNGGSDEATRLQNLQLITSQQLSLNEQERAVVEKLKLAWMSYQYYYHRIRCLKLHADLSKKTADSYAEEYHLGRRSLLDLLNVEQEYIDARKEVARADHELAFSYYRILESLGLLTYALGTDTNERVNLKAPEGIVYTPHDVLNLKEYGETDQYIDVTEVCKEAFAPITQALFDPHEEVQVSNATPAVIIDQTAAGAPKITLAEVYFAFNSAELSSESKQQISPVAERLKEDANIIVEIHGHTDSTGSHDYNQALSKARAESAKLALVEQGIVPERIKTIGHSFDQPIAENTTREGRRLNRRIEFILKTAEEPSE